MSAPAVPPASPPPSDARPWEPGPRRPCIAPGEVHVWRAQPAALAGTRELLSDAERTREQRIAGERQRMLWSSSRGALRMLLARYLRADPAALEIAIAPDGKPRLHDRRAGARELHFNLSHSGELALYAFACDGPVGVDVELADDPAQGRRRDHVALARRVFGDGEASRLQALVPAARELDFLRSWTRYEAALKRDGRGIGGGALSADQPGWIVELELGVAGAAALAGERPASALRLWSFS